MNQFPIFKVNKLTNKNKTETIYVFYGSFSEDNDSDELDKLFKKDPKHKAFENIFNKDELKAIKTNRLDVKFVNQSIHIDDSIGVIKLKIFEAIENEASMSELYLFCLKSEKLNPITIYQSLTQNDKLPLTKVRLNQLLQNLYDEDGEDIDFKLPNKPQYVFDDILKLDLTSEDKHYLVGKPLGQKFVFSSEYPFIANPFAVTEYDSLLENSRKELTTLSGNLLLETGPIFCNTIYLCLAKDVFKIADINKISTKYTSKIYYPFLYQEKIESLEDLDKTQTKLIEGTSEKITSDVKKSFESINMFYNVFQTKKPSSTFSENMRQRGIRSFKVVIYPEYKIKIPIDVIFKLIHATHDFPLIKYNPETRQENIYRLFAPELTADGRKIPYLQKATIFKLMNNIGRRRSVAVYTNIQYKDSNVFMACEFEDNGNISIYPLADFETPILLKSSSNMFEEIDIIIGLAVNPLIEQIKPFFEQSGLIIPLFESVMSVNVEIRNMKYQTMYNVKKHIDIKKIKGCVSSAFTVETDNFKSDIQMRFKRVSNFNKRDSQDAFVIQKLDEGYKFDEIVQQLTEQFTDLTKTDAEELIVNIRSELEVVRGANKRRALMIKINPGFPILMKINLATSDLTVVVEGINDIYYLNTIPVYLDSLIRITQDISSCDVSKTTIDALCSGKEMEDIEFGQITAQSEQVIEKNRVPSFNEESPIYDNSDEGQLMALELFGYEDEDDNNDENEDEEARPTKGGKGLDESSEELTEDSFGNSSKDSLRDSSRDSSKDSSEELPEESLGSLSSIESIKEPIKETEEELSPMLSDKESVKEQKQSEKELPSLSSIPREEEAPKELEDAPKELEESPKELEESPKELEEAPKELEEAPKELEEAPKELEESPKELEKPEEIVPAPKPKKTPKSKPITEFEIVDDVKINKTSTQKKITQAVTELENTVRDITGMKLKYPNPFSTRLEERMPQLFVKSKNDKFDLYTRMCPFNLSERRQPVILTKEERDKIIEEHPGDIDEQADFIEYGTDAKDSSQKYYYTCPKYWCLLTNTMVTTDDIKSGKCGPAVKNVEDAIIPRNAEEVPKGKYVYQFYGDDENKKYPGFHKQKTPSGHCIPCCFSKWTTKEMKNRRDICQGKFDEKNAQKVSNNEKQKEEQIKKTIQETESYVKNPEKYGPQLGEHRWGFLPIAVEKFLHEINEDCQVSNTNTSLKQNHMCILRYGIEVNPNQSFIACIASAIFYAQKDNNDEPLIKHFFPKAKHDVPTIKEMKELIIKSIDLDNFIKYQNGDLVTSFSNPEIKVDIKDYENTKLYKKMIDTKKNTTPNDQDINKEVVKDFIVKVAQSFENFKNFLKDDKITIDYTYLWDLICMPNPQLFEAGINLIILEIPEDDITNNVELVCPTNHYSANTFDARKRSLILIKRENYFEPVYGRLHDGTELHITKTFSEYDKNLPKMMRAVFKKIIKRTLGNSCQPFSDNLEEYNFKQPAILDNLIRELQHKNYKVLKQILNFQGKVIGVIAKSKQGLEGFIPCYPSALTSLKNKKECEKNSLLCDYDFEYMSDDVWKPYEETLAFMKNYYKYKKPDITKIKTDKVNCYDPNYFCQVVEEKRSIVTGFLTNTNQFVPIKVPVPVTESNDEIKSIYTDNMLVADINTLTNNNVDDIRVNYIKKIQLETNFYNVFRNTVRILFNDYTNSKKRKEIKEECNKRYALYKNKLDSVTEMLRLLVENTIIFAEESALPFNVETLDDKDIQTCVSQSADKCSSSSICRMTKNKCQLVLPKLNLINGTDNEDYYYRKMADELIRYNRIKSFIFKPQAYLSFSQIKYNLRDDEIIVLQDLLTQDFFDNLTPVDINQYAQYNTYDSAKPILTKDYERDRVLDQIINPYYDRDCSQSQPQPIQSGHWKKCLPKDYKQISYVGSNFCSLYLIVDLVKEFTGKEIIVENVKEGLVEAYKGLTDNFKNKNRLDQIIKHLKEEAQFDAHQLEDESLTIEQMIYSDGFVAVNFDLWLLLVHYEIPSLFISSRTIAETRFNAREFVCYKNDKQQTQEYVFIVVPGMYSREDDKLPAYKLIVNETGSIKINIDNLKDEEKKLKDKFVSECLVNIEKAIEKYISIETYLDSVYKKDNTTKYKRKQPGIRKLNDDFIIVGDEGKVETTSKKGIKPKKIDETMLLVEAEEALEQEREQEEEEEEEEQPKPKIIIDNEDIQITPLSKKKINVKKKEKEKEKKNSKTKKNRLQEEAEVLPQVTVNPPGKRKTKKKLPTNFVIDEKEEEVYKTNK